jgi:hypothetical protein
MNILFIVIIIILIPFLIAIFTSNKFEIESEIVIQKPAQLVYDYVKLLKNQDHYSKWVMTDPQMKKDFKGVDGNVGFVYAWDSKNKSVGKGENEIINLVEGRRVDTEIRFLKPFESTSNINMLLAAMPDNSTKVQWIFNGSRNYSMKVFQLLFNIDKSLKKDMATSLVNLKNILEK